MACAAVLRLAGWSQELKTLNGILRYEYQYQDFSSGGTHTTASTQSPMLDLGATGSLVDPEIISFDLHTTLNLSNSSSRLSEYTLSTKSFSWNYYDLGLSVFRDLPITTLIRLTDGITQSFSSSPQANWQGQQFRKQQQNLSFSTHDIPFLPSTSFIVYRAHQWSLGSGAPVDQTSTSYSMNLSSGGKGGSVSVSGTMSDNNDIYSAADSKYYNVVVHGMRSLADMQNLNYDVNYSRYAELTTVSGLASYVDAASKEFHLSTTLSSHQNSGPSYQSLLSNLSQSVLYIQNDHFRYFFSAGGNYGRNEYASGVGSGDNSGGSASFSAQHTDSYKSIGISNGLNFGYGIMDYLQQQATFTGGLSNSFSTNFSSYQLSVGHSISYGQVSDDIHRQSVTNSANANITGYTVYNIQGQCMINYQSDVYSGDLEGYGNHKGVQLQWALSSPMMSVVVPFTLGVSGGNNWFYEGLVSRTYNWTASFTSPQFFVRNLSFLYRLIRTFDPDYDRASINHSISSQYRWRAIAIEIRFENYQLYNNRSNFWISFSRPF